VLTRRTHTRIGAYKAGVDVGVAGDMDSCNECRKFLKKRGYIPSKGCGGGCGSGNVNVDVGVCFL